MAYRMADGDVGHIPDEHRRPMLFLDDNVLQILDRFDHPDTADNVSVGGTVENPAPGIRIIASDRLVDLRNGQFVLPQLDGINDHVILLHIAAHRVDIDHTGQPFQQRANNPILQRAFFGQPFSLQSEIPIGGLHAGAGEVVLVHLAQAGGNRRHLRVHAIRKSFLRGNHSLQHELPREIDIYVVVEDDCDL